MYRLWGNKLCLFLSLLWFACNMFMLCIKLFMFMLELHLGIESFLIFNVTYTLCAKNASSSVVAQYRSILIRGLCTVKHRDRYNTQQSFSGPPLKPLQTLHLVDFHNSRISIVHLFVYLFVKLISSIINPAFLKCFSFWDF